MAKIYINIIQSTSEGNSIVLFDKKTYLFLDFGCNPKYIREYCAINYIDNKQIAGVLITHSHIDHIRALDNPVSRKLNIYASFDTWENINKKIKYDEFIRHKLSMSFKWNKIENSDWKFRVIKTYHNAIGSICYIIKNEKTKILYLTDTEYFDHPKFKGMDGYIIESNYASYVLESKSKESKHINHIANHMNSYDVEKFIKKYPTRKTKLFIMSHISSKSNNNFEVLDFMKRKYSSKIMKVDYLNPNYINKEKYEI